MKDRVVQYPNRYKLTQISGDVYDLTPEPGVVTEAGTDLAKATFLKDATAALYPGLPANPVPDEVFAAIPNKINASISAANYPAQIATATWNESVGASATVNKTISHSLGAVPSRVIITFMYNSTYSARVEIKKSGTNYDYTMSGFNNAGQFHAYWKRSQIISNYLFGMIGSNYFGSQALGNNNFLLGAITFSSSAITIPITNSWSGGTSGLSTSVVMEVYA